MSALISIVMPVYNADRFLKKSIESVISQSYKNWELIIVNDGSTDNSESIIRNYAKKHQNIKYFTIENSGSAKFPRDMAIAHSKGNYIITLDADDYLAEDYLLKLWNRHNETKADIVFPKMILFRESNNEVIGLLPLKNFESKKTYPGKDLIKYTLNGWQIGCNGGLYKKEIMNNLSYPLKSYYQEILMNSDEYDTRSYLLNANLVAFTDADYFYCVNDDSITRKMSIKLFHPLKTNLMLNNLIIDNFSKLSVEYKLIQEYIYDLTYNKIIQYISNKSYFTTKEQEEIYSLLKNSYSHIEKNILLNQPFKKIIITYKFEILYTFFIIRNLCKKISHIKI